MAIRGNQRLSGVEIEITDAMIEAGADALIESDPKFEASGDRALAVFRAMMAASQGEASIQAERQLGR